MFEPWKSAAVFQFIREGLLLSGSGKPTSHFIVKDFKEACRLANETEGASETWTHLRSRQSALMNRAKGELTPAAQADVDRAWNRVTHEVNRMVITQLKTSAFLEAAHEVTADLTLIARSLTLENDASAFFGMLWNEYRAGRWPCGWVDGEFPTGKLAVFDNQ